MRKRMVSAALALCLALTLFSGTALAAGEHPFTDVPQGHWAGDAVQYVYENNLMGGQTAPPFPQQHHHPGMIVTVLYRLTGEPASGTAQPVYRRGRPGPGTPRRWLGRRPGTLSTAPAPPLFPPIPHHPGAAGGDLLPLCPGPGMGRVRLD